MKIIGEKLIMKVLHAWLGIHELDFQYCNINVVLDNQLTRHVDEISDKVAARR